MFLPTTQEEVRSLGWDRPDIILVSGDSYIDSPYIGVAVIGKTLTKQGFRVAVIAQPDTASGDDISRLGEPELFWGVTGGCVDSMVANYTATKKRRKSDDYTPGGINDRRPDRAVIAYTNLIRKYFKNTRPIVLGGIEASLRRISHYDFWSNKVRKSILFDAKADALVYGMGEKSTGEIARRLKDGKDFSGIRGVCYISKNPPEDYIELPDHGTVAGDKNAYTQAFHIFYGNNDPLSAKGLFQRQDNRYLVQNPPAHYLTREEMDEVYDMEYERELHPHYRKHGTVRALDTIRFSIPTHRGCYGECNFCAIAVHEGRTVRCRSEESILKEAKEMTAMPGFKGNIHDLGGPTANMYGYECSLKVKKGACPDKRCLFPNVCKSLKPNHSAHLNLLKKVSSLPGIKRVFVSSGIRHDLILEDKKNGDTYLKRIAQKHVSGQMKVAPEHTENQILGLMGKPGSAPLLEFKKRFDRFSSESGKKQFLTYYLIAAHPGCSENDMKNLKQFTREKLGINPEQVQIFTPTPSTFSTLMYYTGKDPFSEQSIFVERNIHGKEKQKAIVTAKGRPASTAFKNKGPGNKRPQATPKRKRR